MEYNNVSFGTNNNSRNKQVSKIAIPTMENIGNNNGIGQTNTSNVSSNVQSNLGHEIESMDLDSEEYIFNNPSVLLEEANNSEEVEVVPVVEVSVNDLFNDILSSNIASNMYDAEQGNFIARERLNDKLWLDKDLIFDEKSNGAYLISIVDEVGNKVAMGFTDADTYNRYMTAMEQGTNSGDLGVGIEEVVDEKNETVSNSVQDDILNEAENINISSLEYINNDTVVNDESFSNMNTTSYNNKDMGVGDVASNEIDMNSGIDYAERYSISSTYSGSSNFNLTTDNNTFTMSDEEVAEVAAIVYGEACEGSPDDALAVASVMANRVDSDRNWGGAAEGLVGVAHANGQFSAYLDQVPKYLNFKEAYQNGTLNEGMQICLDAVRDVMNGVRNNDYESFRSWGSTGYSDNYVVERGNRYS